MINTYNYIIEAARDNKVDKGNISSCCIGKVKSCGGYVWRYYKDSFNKFNTPETQNINILQIDIYGNYINIFTSQAEASRKTGTCASNINRVLKGYAKSAGGFLWRYTTEEEIILHKEGEIN